MGIAAEINSAPHIRRGGIRAHVGGAVAWDQLAMELASAAASFNSVTSGWSAVVARTVIGGDNIAVRT